jgi:hypothetical protein
MTISTSISPTEPAGLSEHRRHSDSDRRSDRAAELAFKAFMSMNRAVAIVGPDGKLLQPNLIFEKLFGDTELLDRINRDAGARMARAIARLPFPMAARSGSRRYRWTAGGWSAPTT